jgi:hypothetical protein
MTVLFLVKESTLAIVIAQVNFEKKNKIFLLDTKAWNVHNVYNNELEFVVVEYRLVKTW